MARNYTLAGEEFFQRMMHPEEQRKRMVVGNRTIEKTHPSNVVSLQEFKQRRVGRPISSVPPKPSA
jgi:hypothetical protein